VKSFLVRHTDPRLHYVDPIKSGWRAIFTGRKMDAQVWGKKVSPNIRWRSSFSTGFLIPPHIPMF
jgi:hypothetical protein